MLLLKNCLFELTDARAHARASLLRGIAIEGHGAAELNAIESRRAEERHTRRQTQPPFAISAAQARITTTPISS